MKHHRRAEPVIKDLFKERISVSLFAGCGGACVGMRAATGNEVDVAINHDKVAIAVHRQNHPTTEHRISDVFEVKPQSATRGRRVGHLHASPDCRHFSRAAGAAPKSDSVRSLADVVIDWARLPEDDGAHPDVITLENVCEFVEWGPLYGERTWRRRASAEVSTGDACPECEWQPTYTAKGKLVKAPEGHRACAWRYVTGQPIPERKGEYFKRWCGDLRALGYAIEWWNLYAHHYGSATSRKRLYLVARCDGEPIVKPPPTHGPGLLPYRTAAEHIDFTLPCPSIFDRKKPLADATLRRVAAGIVRFVLENPKPFIVSIDQQRDPKGHRSVDEPLSTVVTKQRHALVTPFVAGVGGRAGQSPATAGNAPLGTITAKNDRALVTPMLVRTAHGEVDSSGKKRGRGAHPTTEPIGTITAGGGDFALAAPLLIQTGYGERKGQAPRVLDLHKPLGTLMAKGQKHALVSAFISQFNLGQVGHELDKPLPTITQIDHHALVETPVVPVDFAEAYPNARKILPFLVAYYGDGVGDVGQQVDEPLRTITTRDRFGLVTIEVEGATYAIVDIGLRMLEPDPELLGCQFGEYAEDFDLSAATTKADKTRLIGNSVCPHPMRAVSAANVRPWKAAA